MQIPRQSVTETWKDLDGNTQRTLWRNGVRSIELPDCTGPSEELSLSSDMSQSDVLSPLQSFDAFFTAEMKDFVVEQTKIYETSIDSLHMTTWSPLSIPEFDNWISILINFGVLHLPHVSDYWSKITLIPFMQHCSVARDRWAQIRSALHFSYY